MNTRRSQRHEQGFTLVELMVVVAIIGILAAIAIPNFSKYQSRARQSEAKIALSGVYTAEKAFSIENGGFTQCIKQIGVAVDGTNNFYAVGFKNTNVTNCGGGGATCLNFNATTLCSATEAAQEIFYAANKFAHTAATTQSNLPASTISQNAFIAVVAGRISSKAADGNDEWTMNENKDLINSRPGL